MLATFQEEAAIITNEPIREFMFRSELDLIAVV